MNASSRRNLKSKTKTVTLKEIFSKKCQKGQNSASTSNTVEKQNESFIDVFKLNAAKEKTHQTQNKSKPDYDFDVLFSGFKSTSETSKEDGASKSDDSFDELFSDFSVKAETSNNEPKPAITHEEKDFTEILRDGLSPRCPICFRKNNYDSEAAYIIHLKKCAYNNKMTTEQLKKALELQHKQTSERAALGLPIAPKEKPQRKYPNKGPMDSNLELGIALSNSLREYDYMNVIQEKEALVEAGIEPETLSQYKNLEDFGFATNKPAETTNTNFRGNRRFKNPPPRNTALFTRSKEERERIITEKVAILLIDGDCQSSAATEIITEPFILKSKYLKRYIDAEMTLWKKSYQIEEDTENLYYVSALSNFITPTTVHIGSKLRHLSQIPCRPPSPNRATTFKNVTPVTSKSPKKISIPKNIPKKLKKTSVSVNTDSQLRQDWKYMLNKDILSDLTIYTKNEISIFAHKLVFYARCRSILTETIEEVENNKRSEMLMWMEYSFEAVMALLEYIYTSGIPDLSKLGDSSRNDLRALSDKYAFKDVIDALNSSEEAQMFSNDENESSSTDYQIRSVKPLSPASQSTSPVRGNTSNVDELTLDGDESPKNIAVEVTEGEKNLQMMLEAMKTQNLRSPDIFDDNSDIEDVADEMNESHNQPIVDDIISPLRSTVQSSRPLEKRETTPEASILLDVDLTQESDSDKKNVEKRKLFSPLEKNPLKKTKTLSETMERRKPRESPIIFSQPISLSDTSEVSDSDESLYKMRKTTSDTSKSDLNDTSSSIDRMFDKFRVPSKTQTTATCDVPEDPPGSGETLYVLNEHPCQDINPIWDGFEDFNSMPCDYDYIPECIPSPVNKPVSESTSTCKLKTSSRMSTSDSLFGSFAIEEDVLNRIENQALTAAVQKPLQSSTPDSVRKFQRRSRSDNVITPVNKSTWNAVTPMADYSGMKNDDLKKELEKYGIKPGLSRNKAKMMLKYIYEELHPFEDKVNGAAVPEKSEDSSSRKDTKKNHSTNSCESSETDTSGISLLEETYVEDTPEICTQDSGNPQTKVNLQTGFVNLLRNDKILQRKVLLYEPIWLEPLKTTLKEYGVKCSISQLMDYLDEKCITFRTQQQRGRRKKKEPDEKKRTKKRKPKNGEEVIDL